MLHVYNYGHRSPELCLSLTIPREKVVENYLIQKRTENFVGVGCNIKMKKVNTYMRKCANFFIIFIPGLYERACVQGRGGACLQSNLIAKHYN
jgi:hypothetical protein